MATVCRLCTSRTGDAATVCAACARTAHTALARVRTGLADDLDTALAGHTGARGPRAASPEPRLPIAPAAADAREHLHGVLVGWVRVLADAAGEQRPAPGPACRRCSHPSCQDIADSHRGGLPADTLADLARWLSPRVERLRHAPYGPEALDEIPAAVNRAVRAVDIPTRRIPLPAPCPVHDVDTSRPCGGALHYIAAPGLPTDGQIRCAVSRDHVVPANRMIQFARSMRRAS